MSRYDYNLQLDYAEVWKRAVVAYQEICDRCNDVRISIEFKPTHETSRFSIVPSTGAALLLVDEINRENMGLTLDVGHLLMAGENPAQSISMAAERHKLFGIQLGDGHQRLGAEDGLAFASVHTTSALEIVFWLQYYNRTELQVYFDTFPKNEDPVREAEHNIRRFRSLWARASKLEELGIRERMEEHDAMGVLEILEKVE